MIKAKLSGGAKLAERFHRMAEAATSHVLPDAILGSAQSLVEEIKARAPVRSGYLRQRIYASKTKRGSNDQTVNVAYPAGYIVVDVFYARFIEYGTIHAPPHPFVRPVLDTRADAFFHDVGVRFWMGLTRALWSGGRSIESVQVVEGVALGAADLAVSLVTTQAAFAGLEFGVGALEVFAAAAAL